MSKRRYRSLINHRTKCCFGAGRAATRIGLQAGVVAFALAALQAFGAGAARAAPEATPACAVDPAADHLVLSADCVYGEPIRLPRSGMTLDCNGALIDVGRRFPFAIEIGIEAAVSDVSVKRCRVANATNSGIVVGWRSPASIRERRYTLEERYANATSRVSIADVHAYGNTAAGIYVLAYSQDVAIDSSVATNNAGVGVYLAPYSRRARITRSQFLRNGFGDSAHRRKGLGRREAIAIDGSSDNVVAHNLFFRNGGGVYLYKNCQEKAGTVGKNFKRERGSERNRISRNIFMRSPIGVWVAARQSRIMTSWDCGDPYYGDRRYVLDVAPGNAIVGNSFVGVRTAAVVEDDATRFVGNRIVDPSASCVVVGTAPRSTLLARPVAGAVIAGNACVSRRGGYIFAYGATAARFQGNALNGEPVSPASRRCAAGLFPFSGLGVDKTC